MNSVSEEESEESEEWEDEEDGCFWEMVGRVCCWSFSDGRSEAVKEVKRERMVDCLARW